MVETFERGNLLVDGEKFGDFNNLTSIRENHNHTDQYIDHHWEDGNDHSFGDVIRLYTFLGIWELICGVIGAPLNALVMQISWSLIRRGQIVTYGHDQYHHHFYIFSLALANFLFSVIHCPIMFIQYVFYDFSMHHSSCRILYLFTHLSTTASSLSLLWINVNKFVLWKRPKEYAILFVRKRVLLFLISTWLLAISWSLFFIYGPLTSFDQGCHVLIHHVSAYVFFLVCFFVLPILVSFVISMIMLSCFREKILQREPENQNDLGMENFDERIAINHHDPSLSAEGDNNTQDETVWVERNVSNAAGIGFILAMTIWSTLVCFPYRLAFIFHQLRPDISLAKASIGLLALLVTNASGNAMITIFALPDYRNRARKLFCKN